MPHSSRLLPKTGTNAPYYLAHGAPPLLQPPITSICRYSTAHARRIKHDAGRLPNPPHAAGDHYRRRRPRPRLRRRSRLLGNLPSPHAAPHLCISSARQLRRRCRRRRPGGWAQARARLPAPSSAYTGKGSRGRARARAPAAEHRAPTGVHGLLVDVPQAPPRRLPARRRPAPSPPLPPPPPYMALREMNRE